jgi:hypothetical protein
MNLKVPIEILDELAETVIRSTGCLDLASGEIFDVRYEIDRPGLMGMPAVDEQYDSPAACCPTTARTLNSA